MQKIVALLLLLITSSLSKAQHDIFICGNEAPQPIWEEEFQKLIAEYKSAENDRHRNNVHVIPVIFHVVHGGEAVGIYPNIEAGQIQSQLTVLNQDFSGHAYNKSNYPSNAFVNWAINQNISVTELDSLGRIKIADFEIQFCPALKDSLGSLLLEPGINRINYLDKGWPSPNLFTTQSDMKAYLDSIVKPQSIWDVTKYMNVWITDKSNLLSYGGVSSIPPLSGLPDILNGADSTTDGIWCFTKVIGSAQLYPQGTYAAPLVDGRTLTHEAGHYFGLRHIWGDQACGNDFCADTPPAASENTGNPQYPWQPGTCSNPSNQPDGEMFMNFMDYSIGPAKYLFTPDQKIRARTALLNSPFRNQLGTHHICENSSAIVEQNKDIEVHAYPNPGGNDIRIVSKGGEINRLELYNLSGGIILISQDSTLSVEALCAGLYYVKAYTERETYTVKFIKL